VMMGISDRILAINFGSKVALGNPTEVANHPEVVKAYLGDAYA
jgi:branched-chain amino acid transport system ATP-binding protein